MHGIFVIVVLRVVIRLGVSAGNRPCLVYFVVVVGAVYVSSMISIVVVCSCF